MSDVETKISIGGQLIDGSKAPANDTQRSFRDAWKIEGRAIVIDMDAAREVQREAIRRERAGLFPALDADFMKALERGKDTSAIAAKKQALRDAPNHPLIDAAKTPDELRAVTLEAILAPT